MAARSPSPVPSRPKTPEISSLRKSKEIPQRSSLSKPSSPSPRASFEQKENVRSRTPAVSSSKGSKNFMAPTISAASKAIAASPRKKILQERNEVINSSSDSIEFSTRDVGVGVEIQEIGSQLEMGFGSQEVLCCGELKNGGSGIKNHQNVVGFEDIVSKSEMGFGSREVLGSGELRKGEPRIKSHQNVAVPSVSVSPLPFIAPLDADPSLPPYDPKTNFLSPRPQFLHYRPNPRIEHYLNGEREFLDVENGRRLEDTFSSESSEDDDMTVLTEEKEKESKEQSFHSEVEKVKEVGSPSETLVFEPEFKPKPLKPRPFRRSKLVSFLLLLVVACLFTPLSDSPIISSSILKDQSFPKFYTPSFEVFEDLRLRNYLAVAKGNLHGLASKFKHWSADSIAYFASVTSLPKDDVGLYHLANVTSSAGHETARLELSYKPERETKQAIKENLVEEMSFTVYESEVSEVVEVDDAEYGAENMGMRVPDDVIDADTEVVEVDDAEYGAEKIEMEDGIWCRDADTEVVEVDDAEYGAEKIEMEILDEKTDMEYEENEAEKTDEMVVSENGKEGEIDAQRIITDVSNDVLDAGSMGDLKDETDEIELVVLEDLKEAEAGAQGIEMRVSEDVIDADTVGYEMGKIVTEGEGRNELEQEASPISYEAAHINEEVNAEIIGDEGDSNDVDVIDHAQSASSIDNQSEFSEEYQISHGLELTKSLHYATMFGLSLALLLLPATVAFLYMKQKQAPMVEKERQITKKVGSVSGICQAYIHGKGFPSQNLRGNEEMTGDTDPEMSSSWNNTSSSGRRLATRDNEEQDLSNERRVRRDSTASSISYGSFTTYERLSAKRGRDEEVATPVRRSSRIRSLVVSP